MSLHNEKSRTDPMGVFMKYATNTDPSVAKPWSFVNNPWQDSRLICNFKKTPSYENHETTGPGWAINIHRDEGARINVLSTSIEEYKNSRIAASSDAWKTSGFMQKNTDWKNIEMTAYVMGNFETLSCRARYGASFDNENNVEYVGTAYVSTISQDDKNCRFLRGSYNNDSQEKETEIGDEKSTGSIPADRHLGIKFAVYNLGGDRVKMELYLDKTDISSPMSGTPGKSEDDWKLVNSTEDDDQMKVLWGGPVVTFGWENSNWVWFRWASVREIIAP
jgi:hypothetical protein